ncbi:MAG: GNAT family N-acetyltransferase [Bacteroidia bacterium]
MSKYASFETERLILKPTDLDDAEYVFEQFNTPKWLANIGDRNIHSIEDAENYIKARHIPQFDRLGYGNYIMIRKHDQQKIGSCGLYDREGLKGIDIGFALLPTYEGKAYAYEASLRLKEIAIEEFGLRSIGAITTKTNLASQNLLTKLGLEFVEFRKIPGDDEELMYYLLEVKN